MTSRVGLDLKEQSHINLIIFSSNLILVSISYGITWDNAT